MSQARNRGKTMKCPRRTFSERFWEKVDIRSEDECWEWKAYKNSFGYGTFYLDNTMKKAHRIAWMLFNGTIPEGIYVLHKCDSPSCVNPRHLFLGTQRDNIIDMVIKGRNVSVQGERNSHAKLTENEIIEIRNKYIPWKYPAIRLAKEYDVTHQNIHEIVSGNSWKHI